jgi:hypothetical protein
MEKLKLSPTPWTVVGRRLKDAKGRTIADLCYAQNRVDTDNIATIVGAPLADERARINHGECLAKAEKLDKLVAVLLEQEKEILSRKIAKDHPMSGTCGCHLCYVKATLLLCR